MARGYALTLQRQQWLILGLLVGLAAVAWGALALLSRSGGGMGLTMGLSAPLFLLTWLVMMVAMMVPTAAPMVVTFSRIAADRRARGGAFVPSWIFIGAYLVLWVLAGVPAYAAAIGAERLAGHSMWLMENGGRIGGALVVIAGLYQLSPLKRVCLTRCRTPIQFVMTSWRDGYRGAVRMGLEHGLTCLGCCWLLFAILFPLGIMNVGAMALITALIFAEKALPFGWRLSRWSAVALVAFGLVAIAVPTVLPTVM